VTGIAPDLLGAVRVVLVRPAGTGNVGSTARAMKNMGMRDLVLVRPRTRRSRWERAMAVHAGDVLGQARRFASLPEAVADCGLVVGTTCRGGLYREGVRSPEDAAPEILTAAHSGPVALVFGPEDHGLSNDDLRHCQQLVRIPTSDDYPSLNLAQAVLLCCYELRRVALQGLPAAPVPRVPARAEEITFALDRLQAAFLRIGFLNPQNPGHIMLALRRLLGRAGLERRDVRILLGLARQIEWYATHGVAAAPVSGKGSRSFGASRVATRRRAPAEAPPATAGEPNEV
jgi:tRNA/rRNA methyltransferase